MSASEVAFADRMAHHELVDAARKGDRGRVLQAMSQGLDINHVGPQDMSVLAHAIDTEQHEIAKLLIARGAIVDRPDRAADHETPLAVAAENGDVPGIKLLLAAGAQADYRDKYRFTPLIRAAANGHTESARILLDAKADPNHQFHLKAGPLNAMGSPLMEAAREGHLDTVRLLLDRGAKINLTNHHCHTAIFLAALHNRGSVVDLLLERRAIVNIVATINHKSIWDGGEGEAFTAFEAARLMRRPQEGDKPVNPKARAAERDARIKLSERIAQKGVYAPQRVSERCNIRPRRTTPKPNLRIVSIKPFGEVTGGVRVTIENAGPQGATAPPSLMRVDMGRELYDRKDKSRHIRWQEDEAQQVPSIPGGGQAIIQFYVRPDIIQVQATVDMLEQIDESNEGDNQADAPMPIKPIAVIVVGDITLERPDPSKHALIDAERWSVDYINAMVDAQEGWALEAAAEMRKDLMEAGYEVLLRKFHGMAISNVDTALARLMKRHIANRHVRAFAFVGHGGGGNGNAALFLAAKPTAPGRNFPGISAELVEEYRGGSPMDLVILNACFQGSPLSKEKWTKAFAIAPKGAFHSWPGDSFPSTIRAWQDTWTAPERFPLGKKK